MILNHIPVTIGCLAKVTAAPINYQYDQVQILQIEGIELPESYRVDFCNPGDAATITMVGTAEGVEIPNQLLATGRPVIAYVVLTGTDENAVETRYQITLPVNKRPPASDIQPTPAEQSTIDSLIEAMNTAVEEAETAEQGAKDAQQAIEDMTVSAETLAPGSAATVAKTITEDVVHLLFGIPRGQQGTKGDPGTKGDTGNGIESITLISTVGLDKTYRISYTNGDHFDYVVKDGAKGDTGNGIQSITLHGQSGLEKTYRITFTDSTTFDFTVTDGNGIQNIVKTGTSGNVDTYTITYTNGTTSTYTVTNGNVSSVAGKTGAVTLDADDVGYDDTETYSNGTVGAELTQLNQQINDLDDQVNDSTTGLDTKAPVIINSASGAIASFSDGAAGMPIKSLVVDVEPVQDLHGYDNPWPAGGGVNMWQDTIPSNAIAAQISSTGYISTAENAKVFAFPVKRNTDYYLHQKETNLGWNGIGFYTELPALGQTIEYRGNMTNRTSWVLNSGENDYIICQISRESNYNPLASSYEALIAESSTSVPYSPYSNICPISGWTGATISHSGADTSDPDTLNITFPSEAGTVYGGTLDVTTGVLTVDRAMVDLGTLAWATATASNNAFVANFSGAIRHEYTQLTGAVCSIYTESGRMSAGTPNNSFVVNSMSHSANKLYVKDERFTSTAELVVSLAGVYMCYKLATPINYQLDQNILNTLLGTNNIWADAGDVAVEYCADTKLYIEELTKPEEYDMIADQAIASGQFFMIGNSLYLSTTAIAAGGTITPGTNATQLSLADALNQLNA